MSGPSASNNQIPMPLTTVNGLATPDSCCRDWLGATDSTPTTGVVTRKTATIMAAATARRPAREATSSAGEHQPHAGHQGGQLRQRVVGAGQGPREVQREHAGAQIPGD